MYDFLIGLFIFVGLILPFLVAGIISIVIAIKAIKEGQIPVSWLTISRYEYPYQFWFAVAFFIVVGCSIYFGVSGLSIMLICYELHSILLAVVTAFLIMGSLFYFLFKEIKK